jgi:hypothetical protein
MSYATLMAYVNADHVSKQLIGVAGSLANKFSSKLIGISALAIRPPVVAEGVVIVDNTSEFDIAQMKAKLADAENKFRTTAGTGLQIEWRAALELPTDTLIREARCADLILLERSRSSEDMYRVAKCRSDNSGSGAPNNRRAFDSEIHSIGTYCHRMEGYARGEAGDRGCLAIPP